jgi:hypothetical protein
MLILQSTSPRSGSSRKEVRVGPRNKSHYLYDLEFEYEMMRRTQSQLPALPWCVSMRRAGDFLPSTQRLTALLWHD